MTVLKVEAESEEGVLEGFVYDEEATVRIVGDEEGTERSGINRWFNSARINVDPDKDEVTCSVSVGDPRGAFVFTVRRTDDGTLQIHTPYPGESLPHMRTRQLHKGVLEVVDDRGDAIIFEDEEEMDRDSGWRDGWREMEEGASSPDDSDAVFGIDYSNRRKWFVTNLETGRVAKEDDIQDFESADDAAERAEDLNLEALDDED